MSGSGYGYLDSRAAQMPTDCRADEQVTLPAGSALTCSDPSKAMLQAARRLGYSPNDATTLWRAMLVAGLEHDPADQTWNGDIPSLPSLGTNRRQPRFWRDSDVRLIVIRTHRRMQLKEVMAEITAHVGEDRTPSRSALHRAWERIDLVKEGDRRKSQ